MAFALLDVKQPRIVLHLNHVLETNVTKTKIDVNDLWKESWLECLLVIRKSKEFEKLNLTEEQFNAMFESLCIS